jgi:predicted dehydrogenase
VLPDPILIGRNAEKIEALAKAHGIARWGTDLDAALANPADTVFFDAGTTQMRPQLLAKAIQAGKHVYCEKPIATNLDEALQVASLAEDARKTRGLKNGAVQDKLFLPGLRKLDMLRRAGFSAACCRYGWSLATGYSRATCSPFSVRVGTTASRMAVG